ncbi:ECF transporter S component [Ligilactobacillus sp. WILCCON 0076]|uniref:ECF transporter S component n=1 Tax=Ligilactobacillus ubinensis TaxID=2876789 RepID=A0A9X2JKY6_9LACO|nr:ECF transporter S component [Ligilactobacillus ubinensis]MCP0886095.1 ECF transporter S component [Ligilactobacillus ubinensis]
MHNRQKLFKQVLVAIFCAIILVQNIIPFLGYIPIGPLDLTIIHITVVIVALILGPWYGAIVGGFWGLVTFIRAFIWPTSPLATIVFVNPLIAILPRILIGVIAGYTYYFLRSKLKSQFVSMSIAAVLGSLTNTLLVLGQIYLFYRNQSEKMYSLNVHDLLPYLLGVIGTNGIPEAILAGIMAPVIAIPLLKKMKK